jgi:stage II sporulation protein P
MKPLLKIIAGALTTILSISPSFPDNLESPQFAVTPINNGALMLYYPKAPVYELEPELEPEPKDESKDAPEAEPEVEPEIAEISEIHEINIPVFSRNISAQREDLSVFSARDGVVVQRTFRPALGENYVQLHGGGQVRNTTKIDDGELLRESLLPLSWKPEPSAGSNAPPEPQVLIIHTHATESFRLSDDGSFDSSYNFRTLDSRRNIVAVGAKIAEEIAKEGFAVIHDGTLHDYPVFSGSYRRSADTIKAILEEYPSIKVVLDVHRDAIETDDGTPVAAVSGSVAQVMIVSPADDGKWDVPNFMQNFRFASRLQSRLEFDNPGITRALLFQYCNYNLHLSPASLLIEVGSHGNTLEQALNAGELFGQSVGRLLSELAM